MLNRAPLVMITVPWLILFERLNDCPLSKKLFPPRTHVPVPVFSNATPPPPVLVTVPFQVPPLLLPTVRSGLRPLLLSTRPAPVNSRKVWLMPANCTVPLG